jgi:outer membrane protein TolC
MTQLQVGVIQRFPRGRSRELRAGQLREQGLALEEQARDRELLVLLAVREEFLEVLAQRRLAQINANAEAAFEDLLDITRDYYSGGRGQQQDVLRASVELARVQERAVRITGDEERARARLAALIEDAAWQELNPDWPALAQPLQAMDIKHGLLDHPRLRVKAQEVLAADRGVELAAQAHRPEFSLDLSYGARDGVNSDGSDRADLLSIMRLMDVPLFSGKRQDRLSQASMEESSAAMYQRDDVYRRMRSEVDLHSRTLARQQDRLELFENSLLPEARYNSEASFDAYQAALADLTNLVRARITEFDLQLDYQRLLADLRKTQARLLYLQGASS